MAAIRQLLIISLLAISVECYWPWPWLQNNFKQPLRKHTQLHSQLFPLHQLNSLPYEDIITFKSLLQDEISNYNLIIKRITVKKSRGFYEDEYFPGVDRESWLNHVLDEALGSDDGNYVGINNDQGSDVNHSGDNDNNVGDINSNDISSSPPNDKDVDKDTNYEKPVIHNSPDVNADEVLEIDPRKDEMGKQ